MPVLFGDTGGGQSPSHAIQWLSSVFPLMLGMKSASGILILDDQNLLGVEENLGSYCFLDGYRLKFRKSCGGAGVSFNVLLLMAPHELPFSMPHPPELQLHCPPCSPCGPSQLDFSSGLSNIGLSDLTYLSNFVWFPPSPTQHCTVSSFIDVFLFPPTHCHVPRA